MNAEADLIERLQLICGARHVLVDPAELAPYRRPLGAHAGAAIKLVVLPAGAEQVQSVVTACNAAGAGHAVRGAGTTNAVSAPVVIALTRLRHIIRMDHDSARADVEPGVPVQTLLRAAAPAAQAALRTLSAGASGTVGGAFASGAGRRLLRSLDLVTREGELLRLDARTAGYDLCGEFVGSNGSQGTAVMCGLDLHARVSDG